jgi:hypothetical protein
VQLTLDDPAVTLEVVAEGKLGILRLNYPAARESRGLGNPSLAPGIRVVPGCHNDRSGKDHARLVPTSQEQLRNR